jgi:hypothetical protein
MFPPSLEAIRWVLELRSRGQRQLGAGSPPPVRTGSLRLDVLGVRSNSACGVPVSGSRLPWSGLAAWRKVRRPRPLDVG